MTEPTNAEINDGIAKFCGWEPTRTRFGYGAYFQCWLDPSGIYHINPPSYTSSFDALREAMGKMTEQQQYNFWIELQRHWPYSDQFCSGRFSWWLLFHCPVRTIAEAVYQVVKGEGNANNQNYTSSQNLHAKIV